MASQDASLPHAVVQLSSGSCQSIEGAAQEGKSIHEEVGTCRCRRPPRLAQWKDTSSASRQPFWYNAGRDANWTTGVGFNVFLQFPTKAGHC